MKRLSADTIPRPLWLKQDGPDLDVVVSTRCRLARNPAGFPFPWRSTTGELHEVVTLISRGVAALDPHAVHVGRPVGDPLTLHELLANRYVSFKWAEATTRGGVCLWPDGSGSIMVIEEDHLRIQTVRAGLAVEPCIEWAHRCADGLGRRIRFAYDDRHGFLTASLGNTGTGMRLSCLLHLAALSATPALMDALAAARKMNCVVRGVLGEGTPGTGSLVQVSNRCTWGPGAVHAVEQVVAAARYLIARERDARSDLISRPSGRSDLEAASEGARDLLLREKLSATDVMRSISVVRLGMAMGATPADLLRTGEWLALAGVMVWAERHGTGPGARTRALSAIRSGLRAGPLQSSR